MIFKIYILITSCSIQYILLEVEQVNKSLNLQFQTEYLFMESLCYLNGLSYKRVSSISHLAKQIMLYLLLTECALSID